jgi:hypothetical protein
MRRGIFVIVTILAVAVLAGCAQSARPRISDIRSDPQRWSKERVSIFGAVSNSRVADAQPGAALKFKGEYDLTDEFAQVIHVKTTGNPPANGRELWVRGTVSLDAVGNPLLIQKGIPVNPLLIAAVGVLVALAIVLTLMLVRAPGKRETIAETTPCPSCGMANELGSSFCQFCGKSMVLVGPPLGPDVETETSAAEADDRTRFFPPDAPSVADLTVVDGAGARQNTQFPLRADNTRIRIGRKRSDMDIRLDGDDTVSREHAAIWFEDGSFYIQDLASTSGTYVNGQKVVRQSLMDNDEIQLGRTKLIFRMIGAQKART